MAIYETNEVKERVPEVIRNALWIALANLKQPSFSHSFELQALHTGEKVYQRIIHTQKDSVYHEEFKFETENPIDDMRVRIVGFESNWLMLL